VLDATPAGEEVKAGDDHGERRQDEHSVHRVHPVEGLPFCRIRLHIDYKKLYAAGRLTAADHAVLKYGSRAKFGRI
jgi:hypothetical protein